MKFHLLLASALVMLVPTLSFAQASASPMSPELRQAQHQRAQSQHAANLGLAALQAAHMRARFDHVKLQALCQQATSPAPQLSVATPTPTPCG